MTDMVMNSATSTLPDPLERQGIHFDHVTFGYGAGESHRVLRDLSASFTRDRITLVTGQSGSGKSTLLSLAAGIYPHHAGSMTGGTDRVDGQNPASLSPQTRAGLIGMVFQNPSLQFCMDTVQNELLFCLGNVGVARERMPEEVARTLSFTGIRHLRRRDLRSLSGGEKQLVALACIVALNPSWIVLDEPFANVDEDSARLLVRRIVAMHQAGTGVLVIDHRLDHWLDVVDDIWHLDGAKGMTRVPLPDASTAMLQRVTTWESVADGSRTQGRSPVRLALRNLTVERGDRTVLERAAYDFRAGGVYAITGRSGSGKSTVFDAFLGLTSYSGEVLFEGEPIGRRRKLPPGSMGFVTQDPQDQFVADTVYGEIATSLKLAGGNGVGIERIVEETLRAVGLWGHRHFSPYMLSQGQQRRLGVAALVTYDCKVLICDEPTYAQDDTHATAIVGALLAIARDRDVTLIFSTHDSVMARSVADVVLRLEEGQLHEIDQSHV